jgi:hypothetical protein
VPQDAIQITVLGLFSSTQILGIKISGPRLPNVPIQLEPLLKLKKIKNYAASRNVIVTSTYPDELQSYEPITLHFEPFDDFANNSTLYAIRLDHDERSLSVSSHVY